MKTTVDIPEALLTEAKHVAVTDGVTLRELISEGLRLVLQQRQRGGEFHLRDASVGGSGTQPGIDEGDWARVRELIYESRGG